MYLTWFLLPIIARCQSDTLEPTKPPPQPLYVIEAILLPDIFSIDLGDTPDSVLGAEGTLDHDKMRLSLLYEIPDGYVIQIKDGFACRYKNCTSNCWSVFYQTLEGWLNGPKGLNEICEAIAGKLKRSTRERLTAEATIGKTALIVCIIWVSFFVLHIMLCFIQRRVKN